MSQISAADHPRLNTIIFVATLAMSMPQILHFSANDSKNQVIAAFETVSK